jgi:hypothetical protein
MIDKGLIRLVTSDSLGSDFERSSPSQRRDFGS